MNKADLLNSVITQLQDDLDHAHKAALSAHEAATHEENIAENKYDTLGLEAAYLATGQARRYEEIRTALKQWKQLQLRPYSEEIGIQLGNLIQLTDTQDRRRWLFLGPGGASMSLQHDGASIQVIGPQAPLGKALLGKAPGDEVDLRLASGVQEFEVLSVE
ncbi:GreA/GreB family elongation factor [Pseudomonas sp. TTU2014-080ASC]|uniref:GreA/GreB family elongation factor n=1 Tax=Pseudomonas sp. TTU2014-080ASC TaxID=1729724 RepID=UPI0007186601|nr:GreA/GreB family elongation factor [Pseudomonas sp. TTU2014-080ASC]KRW61593.1 transcription elongation factor GreAB [Pseudomonas sp. TTU2014-080ASC]